MIQDSIREAGLKRLIIELAALCSVRVEDENHVSKHRHDQEEDAQEVDHFFQSLSEKSDVDDRAGKYSKPI